MESFRVEENAEVRHRERMDVEKPTTGFAGLRVLALESRRAPEMAKLIANHGGEPGAAPSMREVPLESNTEALEFARTISAGGSSPRIFFLWGRPPPPPPLPSTPSTL